MSAWRRTAIEHVPEAKKIIEQSESPWELWRELCHVFDNAYINEDRKLIRNIYRYATWCLLRGGRCGQYTSEAGTAALTVFYEHIPSNPLARKDMHNYFSRAEFLAMEYTFAYLLEPEEFSEFKEEFLRKAKL